MNVKIKYIVILLQITFFYHLVQLLLTHNVSESDWAFGSYPCVAWLCNRALD